MSIHRGICYPCDQCDYKANVKENLRQHVDSIHVFATPVTNVIIRLLEKQMSSGIKNQNMKVSVTLVINVDIKG